MAAASRFQKVRVIDSHTGGEPTRVVMSGGPPLGSGSMKDRAGRFRTDFDAFRSAVVKEPRGSDITVGALLCEPADASCTTGVIFFNNVGCLGMCGHGTIGLLVTLAYAGMAEPGEHRIETPVGVVTAELHADGAVAVHNVRSYRYLKDVTVPVPGFGSVTGDVAWGGNWFFLVHQHEQTVELANVGALTDFAWSIRQALQANEILGAEGALIDHVELFAPSETPGINSKNFVLCPGKAYDRSPCGTGTSAKLACLHSDGLFAEGQIWRQESIVGSVFEGSIRLDSGNVYPSIKGTAFITAEADLVLDSQDPFCRGIPA